LAPPLEKILGKSPTGSPLEKILSTPMAVFGTVAVEAKPGKIRPKVFQYFMLNICFDIVQSQSEIIQMVSACIQQLFTCSNP